MPYLRFFGRFFKLRHSQALLKSQLSDSCDINNDKETKKALELLNTISQKTIKSLNLEMPKGLSQSILNQKPNEFENDIYRISLELDKSKIDTWNLIISTK